MSETMASYDRINMFAGACVSCGKHVPAKAGTVTAAGVRCNTCTVRMRAEQAPAPQRYMRPRRRIVYPKGS